MNRSIWRYCVRRRATGEIVAEGSERECAALIHCSMGCLQRWATSVEHPEFEVTRTGREMLVGEKEMLIRQWDAFCEPLRKKYGIEVKPWP